jgi:hypothetical protein
MYDISHRACSRGWSKNSKRSRGEAFKYMDKITRGAGLNARYEWEGDEVVSFEQDMVASDSEGSRHHKDIDSIEGIKLKFNYTKRKGE